ncbi:family 43 glycosylhydrolase [Maribellus comscasis]|uniref:Family 43 glycosylhydrolase n=1 Tax=Maribellus comscasis TaxID=2681766 RepID=A0A6I6K1Y3_9BACT|nr:glycoside hydrolase family 43 protein [Maribellus comscasis]QGY47420.1 family 43 glycosylhydrolase [Maribellus comscasis]
MSKNSVLIVVGILFFIYQPAAGQFGLNPPEKVKLHDMHWRDNCILADKASGYYYMVGPGGKSVLSYQSKDLINWENPTKIFTIPEGFWDGKPINSIWAPELHFYKGKYYLFLTIDTRDMFEEQWPNWRPRVTRGSQILVSDSPTGPFKAFQDHSTLPVDMMTLDATLWEEDGVPYIVYAHEWVQISNGTIEYMQLKDDLSETIGEPQLLFRGSDGPWATISETEGCFVTDGPYLKINKTGKLMMVWTSFGKGGYTMGVAFSESGKLAGPWIQQEEPVYDKDGGHGMLFETFDGKLMCVLHSPNNRDSRPHIFEMEDTGEKLLIKREL